ncbi:two-component sensor histidine kinase [Kaistia sp. 32K]|uniref:ATP-binding protein n=1 Tax=Kaistia sp. 32K TaxID=2795690 RepID=UPI001914DE0F|nr:ATP-binding protein [Kaistia sp. 32K]BCP51388.1 two-component sensor histidine kinase [Kaistia sp. 32K]
MNSLRLKIALLVIVAIVAVVGMATLVAVSVIGRPGPARTLGPAAMQIDLIARLVERHPEDFQDGYLSRGTLHGKDLGIRLRPEPARGPVQEELTESLREILAHFGHPREVVVTEPRVRGPTLVSIPIADLGYIAVPLSNTPTPRAGWSILIGWMVAIVLGATAIALVIAGRLTRPLQMIESAVASVGADGVLPVLPETGSADMRATAEALNRLSARLRNAMESRMRLVAAAGHDLRTPMTRMRLRAEFLDDDERQNWLNDLDELDRIADSAIRLVREEVEAGEREPVALDELVRRLTTELAAQGRDLSAGTLEPLQVAAAPLALTRALRNLMINAATHGGGGIVSLGREDGMAVIRITDQGPGIPDAMIERAFEPFFRVDPARRQSVPGAGLGLAIAKEIVERFGGRIAMRNGSDGGLVQEIALPLVPPAGAQPDPASA